MRQVAAELPIVDTVRFERARAQVVRRPIEYAFGCRVGEETALLAGDKPMMQRFMPLGEASAFRARWEAQGFEVETTELAFSRGSDTEDERDDPTSAEAGLRLLLGQPDASIEASAEQRGVADHARVERSNSPPRLVCAYISRDKQRLREAFACHERADEEALGVLLGYPACCATAYAATPALERPERVYRDAVERTQGRCQARLNNLDLAVFHYISWSPCSFSCEASLRYADAVAARLCAGDGGGRARSFLTRIDKALSAHRLVLFDELQISIEGALSDDRVVVERAWSVAEDRHPDVPTDDALREAAARVLSIIAPTQTLAVQDGVLCVAGAPRFKTPRLVLVPFGAVSSR